MTSPLLEALNRPPFVSDEKVTGNEAWALTEALRVVGLILQLDHCGEGQRQDLAFVQEVLRHQQRKPDVVSSPVQAIMEDGKLDEATQAYLLAFGNVHKKKKLKDVAHAVRMLVRLRNQNNSAGVSNRRRLSRKSLCVAPRARELRGIDDWNDFDVFQVAREHEGKPLMLVSWSVLERRGLISHFNLSKSLLSSFLDNIEESYSSHSYHNPVHAADVVHGVHVLLNQGAAQHLSELEVLALIFGAACHDVGHPGVTNNFRVASGDEDAITYSDQSVNEYMHLALTYRTLQRPENDFLRLALMPKQRQALRAMVVPMVLATDMAAFHFKGVKDMQALTKERGTTVTSWDSSLPLLQMLLHGADISNAARPEALARRWTDFILGEFFLQGDIERNLGREISPLCDRNTVSKPGSQVGFISFIVRPTIETLTPFCDTSPLLKNLQVYHDLCSREVEEEKQRAQSQQSLDAQPVPPTSPPL